VFCQQQEKLVLLLIVVEVGCSSTCLTHEGQTVDPKRKFDPYEGKTVVYRTDGQIAPTTQPPQKKDLQAPGTSPHPQSTSSSSLVHYGAKYGPLGCKV
jgi:hypothetical protein